MSDPNFKAPEPGDPGTPRDVNRDEDVVWDGNDPERYAGQTPEPNEDEKQPAKKTARKAASADKSDSTQ